MTRKRPYPKEAPTNPAPRRKQDHPTSGPAPKLPASEVPTLPPPAPDDVEEQAAVQKNSGVRPRPRRSIPAATVDEVTADLSKDPRREED